MENWGSSVGVMVCRLYKALFSFTVTGWVSAVASVILDLRTRRKQVSRGEYQEMGVGTSDIKLGGLGVLVNVGPQKQATPAVSVEPYRSDVNEPTTDRYRPYHHDERNNVRADLFGYNAPAEQTRYDAGSYGDRH